MRFLGPRIGHYRAVLHPAWRFLFAIPFALFSVCSFARDEFLSSEQAANLKMSMWLPHWPWYIWAIVFLITLVILILEGSYRVSEETRPIADHASEAIALASELRLQREAKERENDPIEQALRAASAPRPSQPSPPYEPREGREPLLEFLRKAECEGWDISGKTNTHIVDLLEGLAQAALDGDISFWGRHNRNASRKLIERERLVEIERAHWVEYVIDITSVINAPENLATRTSNWHAAGERHRGGYVDLHLDGLKGVLWLRGPGMAQWKGRRDRAEATS